MNKNKKASNEILICQSGSIDVYLEPSFEAQNSSLFEGINYRIAAILNFRQNPETFREIHIGRATKRIFPVISPTTSNYKSVTIVRGCTVGSNATFDKDGLLDLILYDARVPIMRRVDPESLITRLYLEIGDNLYQKHNNSLLENFVYDTLHTSISMQVSNKKKQHSNIPTIPRYENNVIQGNFPLK